MVAETLVVDKPLVKLAADPLRTGVRHLSQKRQHLGALGPSGGEVVGVAKGQLRAYRV